MSCYLWNYVRKWGAKAAAAAAAVVDGFVWSSSLSCNNTGAVPEFDSPSRIFSVWQKSHSCHTRLCSKPNISNQISSITKKKSCEHHWWCTFSIMHIVELPFHSIMLISRVSNLENMPYTCRKSSPSSDSKQVVSSSRSMPYVFEILNEIG